MRKEALIKVFRQRALRARVGDDTVSPSPRSLSCAHSGPYSVLAQIFSSRLHTLAALALYLSSALLFVPQASAEKLFRWVDEKGVVHYTERLPTEATGKANAQMNSQGTVVKQNAAALTRDQIAAREEAALLQREAEKRALEETRKNEALLKTYASAQDINDARHRALANNQEAIRSARHNVTQAKARQKELQQEAAAFKDKRLPIKLQRDLEANEVELRHQTELFDVKQRDVAAITHRYDEDERRYDELTRGNRTPPPLTSTEISKK